MTTNFNVVFYTDKQRLIDDIRYGINLSSTKGTDINNIKLDMVEYEFTDSKSKWIFIDLKNFSIASHTWNLYKNRVDTVYNYISPNDGNEFNTFLKKNEINCRTYSLPFLFKKTHNLCNSALISGLILCGLTALCGLTLIFYGIKTSQLDYN